MRARSDTTTGHCQCVCRRRPHSRWQRTTARTSSWVTSATTREAVSVPSSSTLGWPLWRDASSGRSSSKPGLLCQFSSSQSSRNELNRSTNSSMAKPRSFGSSSSFRPDSVNSSRSMSHNSSNSES